MYRLTALRDSSLAAYARDVYLPARLDIGSGAADNVLRTVRHLDAWACETLRLEDLSEEVLCRYLRHRLGSGIAATTCNGERARIMALWHDAAARGYVPEPPKHIPKFRTVDRTPDAWTPEELRRLLGVIGQGQRADYWRSLTLTILDTALRIGAVRRVAAEDARIQERLLVARAAPSRKQWRDQWFELSPVTVTAIARVWSPRATTLWPGSRQWQEKWFRRIVEAARIPCDGTRSRQLFHKLRRSAITLTAATRGLTAAAEKAGHASVATTKRFYIDPSQAPSPSILEAAGIL